MKIGQILDLEVDVSGLSATGTVGWIGQKKHITGSKNGRAYDFWSQFMVLKDETGDIGVSVSGKEDEMLDSSYKDKTVTVHKCVLESYEKDNQTFLKLKGFIQHADSPHKPSQAVQNAPQTYSQPQGQVSSPKDHERLVRNRGIALSYVYEHLTLITNQKEQYERALQDALFMETGKIPLGSVAGYQKMPPFNTGQNQEPVDDSNYTDDEPQF